MTSKNASFALDLLLAFASIPLYRLMGNFSFPIPGSTRLWATARDLLRFQEGLSWSSQCLRVTQGRLKGTTSIWLFGWLPAFKDKKRCNRRGRVTQITKEIRSKAELSPVVLLWLHSCLLQTPNPRCCCECLTSFLCFVAVSSLPCCKMRTVLVFFGRETSLNRFYDVLNPTGKYTEPSYDIESWNFVNTFLSYFFSMKNNVLNAGETSDIRVSGHTAVCTGATKRSNCGDLCLHLWRPHLSSSSFSLLFNTQEMIRQFNFYCLFWILLY